jgi:hypothetical protein
MCALVQMRRGTKRPADYLKELPPIPAPLFEVRLLAVLRVRTARVNVQRATAGNAAHARAAGLSALCIWVCSSKCWRMLCRATAGR